jgi:hypothetical protein
MRIPVEEMEKNLLDGFYMTTPVQRYKGLNWYPQAHDFADVIGNGNVMMGAGILACLSANKAWDINRRLAVDACNGIFAGHVGNALDKARAIYAGADPETVLPMGRKTGHFYMNILDPMNPDYVTIDRHMIRVAKLEWDNGSPTVTLKEYDDVVLAAKLAAAKVGVASSAFQAMVWEWSRAH